MLFVIVFSLIISVSVGLLTQTFINKWIEEDYNSETSRKQRHENYIENLQTFIDKNNISSNDTEELTRWVRSNRNIYLFIYKDNQLFFDSGLHYPLGKDEESEKDDSTSDESGKEDSSGSSGETNEDFGSSNDENDKNEDATENDEYKENDPGEDLNGADKDVDADENPVGEGITVQYPTREEVIASAKSNGLLPLNLSDGMLFVSLADYTEYLYYDIANITSIVVGVFLLILMLMLYFQNIISKISKLAKDVSMVYEVDMNTKIRTEEGSNEFSKLTRNVEQMRSSMKESLENEKAAINSNTELITSMSHDIRTPLTVLLGYIDIMKNYSDDEIMQEYIKASESTAMKLKNLSDDMFRYFLVFSGKEIKAELIEYDAKTLFDQLLSEHVFLLREREYDVCFEHDNAVYADKKVLTDAPKLMRVVDNLFSNIYKYADKNKTIRINSELSSNKICVSIENGIADFDTEVESYGVGLKTCKKLCEAMNIDFDYGERNKNGEAIFEVRMKFAFNSDKSGVKK